MEIVCGKYVLKSDNLNMWVEELYTAKNGEATAICVLAVYLTSGSRVSLPIKITLFICSYSDKTLFRVEPYEPKAMKLTVNTLTGLLDYIKSAKIPIDLSADCHTLQRSLHLFEDLSRQQIESSILLVLPASHLP